MRTKKSDLLVGGDRRRADRCELFFHVAGDLVNAMVMEGRRPGQDANCDQQKGEDGTVRIRPLG